MGAGGINLDLLVVILAKPDIPHQLSGKLSIIRKKLKGSQSPHVSAITHLLDEIEALSDTRHDYVHGSIIEQVATRSELTVTGPGCYSPGIGHGVPRLPTPQQCRIQA
jgi:hypothetical protein